MTLKYLVNLCGRLITCYTSTYHILVVQGFPSQEVFHPTGQEVTGASEYPHHSHYIAIAHFLGNSLILKYNTIMLYTILLLVFLVFLLFYYFHIKILVMRSLCSSPSFIVFFFFFVFEFFAFKKKNRFCFLTHIWNFACPAKKSPYICWWVVLSYLLSWTEGGFNREEFLIKHPLYYWGFEYNPSHKWRDLYSMILWFKTIELYIRMYLWHWRKLWLMPYAPSS